MRCGRRPRCVRSARSWATSCARERGLDFAVRIGVNTGQAVTGAGTIAGSFTSGDTVNVAARLEQAAPAGEILLGRETFRLVRHAIDAEPVAPLTLKGKSEPVEAHRLLAVARDAQARAPRPRAPMVGRQRERRRLLDAFHQAVADRSCQLFTVLGAAGVGKSRLVREVVETIDGAATVVAGRCLPYGDGLTWWPLAEALGGGDLLERAAADHGPAAARVAELLTPAGAPVAPEEAFWAVRKVLEALARRHPLVLVVDDLQWAEPTFVELVEHVAEWTRDAPLVLLIMARPDLLDSAAGVGRRPAQRDDGAARAAARGRRPRPPRPPHRTGRARGPRGSAHSRPRRWQPAVRRGGRRHAHRRRRPVLGRAATGRALPS